MKNDKVTQLQHALKYKGSTMTGTERERIRSDIAYYKKRDRDQELWHAAAELGISLSPGRRGRKIATR